MLSSATSPHLKLPILDLKRQHQQLAGELQDALSAVIESGAFILGPRVSELEVRLAEVLGQPHAVGVASGTEALLLALMALEVGPGDEVITTPYSFFATASEIARLGARPVFVDVDDDFLLDLDQAEAALTERTRAFLPVHLFGRLHDLRPIRPLLDAREIPIVEDTAQALDARDGDVIAGGQGRLSTVSFYPTKNLGGIGDGGLVGAADADLAEKIRRLRAHGSADRYHHEWLGINSRLDELQAAALLVKLPHLHRWNLGRREVAEKYRQAITNPRVVLPSTTESPTAHVHHQFVIRHPDRDGLRERLTEAEIGTSIFYPVPLHLQPCFSDLGYRAGQFPRAEQLTRESLALPIFPEMTDAEIGLVADVINAEP